MGLFRKSTDEKNINKYKQNGLSFNYPNNYLIANIPDNCPECKVALAKDDGKCDILIEVSEEKINYQKNVFENAYINYVKNLDGFFEIESIGSLGNKKPCFITKSYFNKNSLDKQEIVKSVIFFDFNFKNPIRIHLNSLLKDEYDCMNDLKIISKNLNYK
ncbi:hypothetical protein SAMN05216439_0210 [Methanobrevibacter gottschalkii]|uniref:Uncharacterized protein n=2 Tax=Methanobrevibacter gottschalkii TaxID=190974 RepID=A0A1H7NH01_9EURY|nr:hypothetical protein SAMN05216439_0210 [Methanobrevibacter gottschalkii]